MEMKEDSYEGNGDISDERQDDGNMDGDENEDDGDVSQGDESCDTDDDISEDDSHIGDPDYVPPVEICIDEADSPDSNGLFVEKQHFRVQLGTNLPQADQTKALWGSCYRLHS
eukprot:Em1248g1a